MKRKIIVRELMLTAEVARLLGISPSTLRNWRDNGRLNPECVIDIGGHAHKRLKLSKLLEHHSEWFEGIKMEVVE